MRRHGLFLFVFLLCYGTVSAQTPLIERHRRALSQATSDRERSDLHNELSNALYNYDLRLAYQHAQDGYEAAEKAGYDYGMRYALILRSLYFYADGQYDESIRLLDRSYAMAEADDDLKAYGLIMKGNSYMALAKYDSADLNYQQAIAIEQGIGSIRHMAYVYKNLGRMHLLRWNRSQAKEYFLVALGFYERSGQEWGKADTWFSLAEVMQKSADFDSAGRYLDSACTVATRLDDVFLKLYCDVNRGEMLINTGEYRRAQATLFEAIEKVKDLQLPQVEVRLYQDLGDVYEFLGQNEVAMTYYLEALKLAERLNIKYEVARVLSSLSFIHKNQRNFSQAHDNVDQSLALRRQIGDKDGVAESLNKKGLIYLDQRMYDSALQQFSASIAIWREIGNRESVSTSLFNQGKVLDAKGDFRRALELYREVLVIEHEINNPYNLGIAYNDVGRLYTRMRDFDNAQKYLTASRKLAESNGFKTIMMDNNFHWSAYYEARGDFKKAMEFHKAYAALNDSIYFETGAGKLAELQALYQLEKKDREIQFLNQERKLHENEIDLQRSRIRFQTIIIIAIILGLLLVSLLALKSYQYNRIIRKAHREITEQKEEIQSQSEELKEANGIIASINKDLESKIEQRTQALAQAYKELDTFFYRSSHDFRRPLTTFLGLAEVANVTVRDKNALELFEKVRDTARNLDKMLVKLQTVSDVGSQQLIYKEVLIRQIFDSVCDTFRDELERLSIRTSCEVNLRTPFVSYPAMVKTIIENLVENAIKFCGAENRYVRLRAHSEGAYVIIDIQDNGEGIGREYHEQIFDMYFRASDRSKGNGLGLYIVRKAVEKLEGSITLSSVPGAGTTFTVMLPNNL